MGRLWEVALLLTLCLLLGSTGAYYDYDDFDEDGDGSPDGDYDDDGILDEDYYGEEDIGEEDADTSDSSGSVERPEGSPPRGDPTNRQYFPGCNNEECWIRVDWEPPERDTWMSCMLGYKVGYKEVLDWFNFDGDGILDTDHDGVPDDEDFDDDMDGIDDYEDLNWINYRQHGTNGTSTLADDRSGQIFFLEEAEGTNHSLTIHNLKFNTSYFIDIAAINPYGPQPNKPYFDRASTPPEPCRDSSVSQPDKFVKSSDNSLDVHLDGWEDTNCRTLSFVVEQRQRGEEDWSLVSRTATPGTNLIVSNLNPATWYQIKVTGNNIGHSPDQETRDTSLQFEIATLAEDNSGYSGCVIENNVKYSGNNLMSKRGINQETCALLCFKKPACTHWTYNPTFQGGKCWLKTSDSGRAKSTTGSSSGQKACGGKGFSLPEVAKAAAAAMADCNPPWVSLETGCYLFRQSNSTWYESRGECQQSGGYLIEIDSHDEHQAIVDEIHRRGWEMDLGFWIGLTDIFHDGTWVWDHLGRPLDFSKWAPGEPNNLNGLQHCAAIDRTGWTDVSCDSEKTEQYGYGTICEAAGSSITYTKETGKKWQNEVGKTSHMKVLMVHDEDDCGKECTATAPCVAFTFIPGMEICALKAPKDAATLVPAGGDMISGRLDGDRPGVQLKVLDSLICLPCLPACNVEEGTKYSGHNLFPLGAETQEECAAACLREPECHFWTHNPNVGKCWLKKSDLGRAPSTKGSNSGQKSCGVTEDDIRTGHIVEDGCACKQEGCSLEEDTKYSGHNLYTTKGIKVGNMAGCAALCFEDSKCKFWTYNPRVSKCWLKTSDQGKSPSTKGSISGQKACGRPGVLPDEPDTRATSGEMTSPNFPSEYPSRLHQRKTIQVAKGKVINIHFTDFEVEHPGQFDYVEITDGDGSRLGRFSADQNDGPPDVTSNTETVHVLFHTDEATAKRGWRLEWSASESKGERPTNGILTSTNYPNGYPNNEDHTQTIRVPKGNTIRMEFLDFRVEDCPHGGDSPECPDFVIVTDDDGTLLAASSDVSLEDLEIVSRTETVHVRFSTDQSISKAGWRLSWGMVGTLPKNGVLTSPGYPGSYPSSHDSTQTIQVAPGKGVKLHFTHADLESKYDYVHIVDDDGHDHYLHSVPDDMVIHREYVDVVFHTDGSVQRSGWRLEWSEV